MSRTAYRSPAAFSDTAAAYAATMAPSLTPVAAEVVRRAALAAGETVLDAGTGTGTAARLALGDGRHLIGLDAAPGMLDIARASEPAIEWIEADFGAVPLEAASVDAVIAAHALLFAADRVAVLREWRRVTRPGGRLSISVPGPSDVVPGAVFGHVYERYGVGGRADDYPDQAILAGWADAAGWADVQTDADASATIDLPDEDAFRTWLRVGRPTTGWSPERIEAFAADLMAAAPRRADGSFAIPFGALYLTARRPS